MKNITRNSFRHAVLGAALAVAVVPPSGLFAVVPEIFSPGNLVLSRTIYTPASSAVPFPGMLPNGAASVANASYPAVFNNETPDAAFGITTPIFLDHLTTSGSVLNTFGVTDTLAANPNNGVSTIATSFPSKSEMGLNVTPDGTGVTFMAYNSASSQLDVSNSNTTGHLDITNPVNAITPIFYDRTVVEVSYQGTVLATPTHAYSGNNGRNAVYSSSTGNYYMVGNAGNNGSSITFAAGTVTITSGSPTVTLSGASNTANIYVGTPFSGTNIPVGSYVTAVATTTQFTISANATGTATGTYIANAGAIQLVGCTFSSGSTNVTVSDTSKLVVGMPVSGTGVATSAYIQTITSGTQFTLSAVTTAASSASASYTASVSNSMLSDNTGVQMITRGGSGESTVVGKVNGTYGTTPGYQRGFTVSQLPATTSTGTTGNSSTSITNVPTAAFASLSIGQIVSGANIPTGDTIKTLTPGTNTIVLSTAANATGATTNATLTFTPAADKSGKDDNFRGLTSYNNTIYISKGSGGNGLDAVYQVNPNGGSYVAPGTSAGVPTSSNASAASINPIPGWPTSSTGANESKNSAATVHHPFGMWFANDTTLYVADEGGPTITNAAQGGLQKWTWDGSKWNLLYTLTNGALSGTTLANGTSGGTPYTVTNPNNSLNTVSPTAVGLRNISGQVNGDGTVTIFAVTSTISSLVDVGADPNQLVKVTDTLSYTTIGQAASETLTVLKTAQYGEALRGVACVPARISISVSGYTKNNRTGKLSQVVTLTNKGTTSFSGPIQYVLDGLNTTVAGQNGTTANNAPLGSPYITATTNALAAGASMQLVLNFTPPSSGGVTYTPRTVTGTSAP
jgi:hypothetical protein